MKSLSYWQQFLNTGRVEDYLCYVRSKNDGGQESREDGQGIGEAGAQQYAGVHMDYRNGIETDSLRGI